MILPKPSPNRSWPLDLCPPTTADRFTCCLHLQARKGCSLGKCLTGPSSSVDLREAPSDCARRTRCQGRCGSRPSLAGVQRADKPRARQRPRERSCGRANSLLVPMHGSFGLGRSHGVRWPGLCPPRGRCGSLGFFPRPAGQRAGRLRMLQRSRRCQARWQHAIGYWSWLAAPALRCRANVGPKCEVAAQATAGRFPAADRSVVTLVYSASMSRPGVEMQPARAKGIARLRMLSITGGIFPPCSGDFGKAW